MTESEREKAVRQRSVYCDSANEILATLADLCDLWECDLIPGGACMADLEEIRDNVARARRAVVRLTPMVAA
jgi:hypothetical protein